MIARGRLDEVRYEMFASDLDLIDYGPGGRHDDDLIDRDVVMVSDGVAWYASWIRSGVDFVITMGRESEFNKPPEVIRSMGDTANWRSLVGKDVDVRFTADSHQAVRITDLSDPANAVFVCAYDPQHGDGGWGSDVVYITRALPTPPACPRCGRRSLETVCSKCGAGR